jgi:hypothetical protein
MTVVLSACGFVYESWEAFTCPVASDESIPLSPPAICVNQLSRDDVDDTAVGPSPAAFDEFEIPPSAICCRIFDRSESLVQLPTFFRLDGFYERSQFQRIL